MKFQVTLALRYMNWTYSFGERWYVSHAWPPFPARPIQSVNKDPLSDWIGRAGKGGQAWLTYHLSPNEYVQFMYRNAKVTWNFIPGGTTQNLYQVEVTKRVHKDIEIKGWVQYEGWKAPIYKTGLQNDTE